MIKEQTSYGDQTCRIHPHFPQRAQPDPGAAGRSTGCHRGCRLQMGSRPVHTGIAADRGNGRLFRYVHRCPAGLHLKGQPHRCHRPAPAALPARQGLERSGRSRKGTEKVSQFVYHRLPQRYAVSGTWAVQTGQRQTAPRPGTAGKSPSASAPEYQPPHQRANALRCYGGNQPGLGG